MTEKEEMKGSIEGEYAGGGAGSEAGPSRRRRPCRSGRRVELTRGGAAAGRGAAVWWRSCASPFGEHAKWILCMGALLERVFGMKNTVLIHFWVWVMLLETWSQVLGVTCQTQISGNHD